MMKSEQKTSRSEIREARKQHALDKLKSYFREKNNHAENAQNDRCIVFSNDHKHEIIGKFPPKYAGDRINALSAISDVVIFYWSVLTYERSDLKDIISSSASFLKSVRALDTNSLQVIETISEYDGEDDTFFQGAPTPTQGALIEELGRTSWISARSEAFLQHTVERVERLNVCAQLALERRRPLSRGTKRETQLENLVLSVRNIWVSYLFGEDRWRNNNVGLRPFIDTVVRLADPHVTRAMIDTALRKIDRIPPRNSEHSQG